jgi:hypothetical protein
MIAMNKKGVTMYKEPALLIEVEVVGEVPTNLMVETLMVLVSL